MIVFSEFLDEEETYDLPGECFFCGEPLQPPFVIYGLFEETPLVLDGQCSASLGLQLIQQARDIELAIGTGMHKTVAQRILRERIVDSPGDFGV